MNSRVQAAAAAVTPQGPDATVPNDVVSAIGRFALARSIPGALGFMSLAAYTRLLPAYEYGQFTLTVTTIGLANSLIFYWVQSALLRFLPGTSETPARETLLKTALCIYSVLLLLSCLLLIPALLLYPGTNPAVIFSAFALLLSQAWFDFKLVVVRSNLSAIPFATMGIVRSVLSLALGSGLGLVAGAPGLLLGMTTATVLASITVRKALPIRQLMAFSADKHIAVSLFSFGIPLAGLHLARFIINSSDRYMLAIMMDPATAGIYGAAYDFADNSLMLVAMSLQIGAYPSIMKAFSHSSEAGSRSYQSSVILSSLILIPFGVGLACLARPVASVVFPPEFHQTANAVIPLIAASTTLVALRAAVFNIRFHLTSKTGLQLYSMLIACAANVAFNFVLIPRFGAIGAAASTLAAHTVGLASSAWLARGGPALKLPWNELGKIIIATSLMSFILLAGPEANDHITIIALIIVSAAVYLSAAYALNVSELRPIVRRLLCLVLRRSER